MEEGEIFIFLDGFMDASIQKAHDKDINALMFTRELLIELSTNNLKAIVELCSKQIQELSETALLQGQQGVYTRMQTYATLINEEIMEKYLEVKKEDIIEECILTGYMPEA